KPAGEAKRTTASPLLHCLFFSAEHATRAMIPTPYRFEPNLSEQDFQTLGQFALRWSHIDHTIGNCLRRVLNITPADAAIMIFPLTLDMRMARIAEVAKIRPLDSRSAALFEELRPCIKAMQFLRNSAVHGIIIGDLEGEEPYFHLRSKNRKLPKAQLF